MFRSLQLIYFLLDNFQPRNDKGKKLSENKSKRKHDSDKQQEVEVIIYLISFFSKIKNLYKYQICTVFPVNIT